MRVHTYVYYMHFKLHAMLQVICMQDNVFYHCCSPGFKLFYPEDPLWMLRGEGQYLYDDQGIKYLDCVNNISHGMYTYICMYICVNRLYSRLIMIVLFNYYTKLFFHCMRMPLRLQSILCVYSFYNCFHHFYM